MQVKTKEALFLLGQIVATPGALAALGKAGQTPLEILSRHAGGDWGELDEQDRKENALSLIRDHSFYPKSIDGHEKGERTMSRN